MKLACATLLQYVEQTCITYVARKKEKRISRHQMMARMLHLQGAAAIILILFVAQTLSSSSVHGSATSSGGCVAIEKEALISFKQGILDDPLASWRGEDCCRWKGVRCSNRTGHVIKLDLGYKGIMFPGGMSSSISTLQHLRYLDLSGNYFNSTRIPTVLGTLRNLRHLDLSWADFVGTVPLQLSNLTHLEYLDISYSGSLNVLDLSWLPTLSSLKSLDMTGVDLSSVRNWVKKVNMLPNLEVLSLFDCGLSSTEATLSQSNLTHLEVLGLSHNSFNSSLQDNWFWNTTTIKDLYLSDCEWSGPIPDTLGNMSSLELIDLSTNYLLGIIPTTFKHLCSLQQLYLFSNNINGNILERLPECSWSKLRELYLHGANLTGQLPFWIGNLTNLSSLDISQNMMDGQWPVGIGDLRNLTVLRVGFNNFSGTLSEEHFSSLMNIQDLDLSHNSLKLHLAEDWVPPFSLVYGNFRSCDMGPRFPAWLKWQADVSELDISNTSIDDVLPHWFWATFANAYRLDLSRNQLSGSLPANLELSVFEMDLSGNLLSGQLPANLTVPHLSRLLLHNNHFTGTIPAYFCNGFSEINLSNNQLTGDSLQCPEKKSTLIMVDLKKNNISGKFPRFLRNAAELSFLDLSYNKFSGRVPPWIAEKMPSLEVLILRSNMFHGQLPRQLSNLVGLHYLDLAHNNISGSIPSSVARLRAMTRSSGTGGNNNYSSDSISTFIKDRELNYTHETTRHIVLIDFSSNAFTGYIPKELFLLKGLRSLNLSSNQISGSIPSDIGDLRELESLDLSYNYLTGEIPSGLSDLTFLSCLNLSYNDLYGRIPSGHQLQTLNDEYMYIGNPRLCGPPLLKNCTRNETNQEANEKQEWIAHDVSSYYLSMSIGFLMGLWMVFCTMLFKKTWRIAYFQLLDQLYDKVYVQITVKKNAFMRKFQHQET
ncbi:hypothetical protein ACP4OV_011520 [Aristida adscensionis]